MFLLISTTTYEVIDTLSKKYAYPVQEYIYAY